MHLSEGAGRYLRVAGGELSHDLEKRVSERTQELAQANKDMHKEVLERRQSEEVRVQLLQQLVRAQEDGASRLVRSPCLRVLGARSECRSILGYSNGRG